jgi:hypothetical protein
VGAACPPRMPSVPVVGTDDQQLAVVDHVEGTDAIKLAKSTDGRPHYIPLTWVSSVDDKVHLDRTSDQARKQWSPTPAVTQDDPAPRYVNSVDATIGQPIIARILTRKHELEAALDALPGDDIRGRGDIELALATIEELLTGDLHRVPATVLAEMNRWLERNKHLAERTPVSAAEPERDDEQTELERAPLDPNEMDPDELDPDELPPDSTLPGTGGVRPRRG